MGLCLELALPHLAHGRLFKVLVASTLTIPAEFNSLYTENIYN